MTRRSFAARARAFAPIALAVGACADAGDPNDVASWAGRETCAECHAAEAALWTGSHHDLAMQEATPATVLGDFDNASITYRAGTTTFFRRDDGYYVRSDGPDGVLTEYTVAYTFGADPLQQYLVPFPGGRFQALGVAWDTRPASDGGQRWFALDPGMDVGAPTALHWTRPSENWNVVCADCHSTGLNVGFDLATRRFKTTWAEIDVGCEACHGPGSRHVSLMSGHGTANTSPDLGLPSSLVDRARTWTRAPGAPVATRSSTPPSNTEVDACARCHSRRATVAMEHTPEGALLDAYRPSLLREDLYHADGQIDDEVYVYGSFVQSRMYAAGVTCSDCHDPHSLRLRVEGNGLCTRCHDGARYDTAAHHFHEPAADGAACVECHMPARTYMRVDPRRDHSLRIPRPDLTRDIGTPNACNGCHVDRSPAWAADVVDRQYGPERASHFAATIHGGRVGDPAAFAPLVELAGDPTKPAIVRGTALSLLSGYARSSVVETFRLGLTDPEPLVRLGALEGIAALPDGTVLSLAYPLLTDSLRALRFAAVRLLAALPGVPMTPDQSAAIARGFSEYERAQRSSAHSGAWVQLGDVYAARSLPTDAEAAYRTALALDSTDLTAYVNYADLQRALGRDDRAEELLYDALALASESSELLHATGLLKVRQGDAAGALPWLERAARSNDARFAYVYGVALVSSGEMARGLEVLEAALQAHPWNPDILAALATYNRDRGQTEAALRHAERLAEVLPEDPGVRELLGALRATRH